MLGPSTTASSSEKYKVAINIVHPCFDPSKKCDFDLKRAVLEFMMIYFTVDSRSRFGTSQCLRGSKKFTFLVDPVLLPGDPAKKMPADKPASGPPSKSTAKPKAYKKVQSEDWSSLGDRRGWRAANFERGTG